MRRGYSHTASAGSDQPRARGQTTQDFVVGIGIFILAVAFVFTTVPSFVDIQTGDVDSGDSAQVERVAGAILENESLATDTPNEIDGDEFADIEFDNETLGLRATDERRFDRVNATVEPLNRTQQGPIELDDGRTLVTGDKYANQTAVTATRIVSVTNVDGMTVTDPDGNTVDVEDGDPVRLVVRMW